MIQDKGKESRPSIQLIVLELTFKDLYLFVVWSISIDHNLPANSALLAFSIQLAKTNDDIVINRDVFLLFKFMQLFLACFFIQGCFESKKTIVDQAIDIEETMIIIYPDGLNEELLPFVRLYLGAFEFCEL